MKVIQSNLDTRTDLNTASRKRHVSGLRAAQQLIWCRRFFQNLKKCKSANNQCSVWMFSGTETWQTFTVEAVLVVTTTSPDLTPALRERHRLSEQFLTLLLWLITRYDSGQAKPSGPSQTTCTRMLLFRQNFSPLVTNPNQTLHLIEGKIDLGLNNQSFYWVKKRARALNSEIPAVKAQKLN